MRKASSLVGCREIAGTLASKPTQCCRIPSGPAELRLQLLYYVFVVLWGI